MNLATLTHKNIVKNVLGSLGVISNPDDFYIRNLSDDKFILTYLNRDYDVTGVRKISLEQLFGNSPIKMDNLNFTTADSVIDIEPLSGISVKPIDNLSPVDDNKYQVYFNRFVALTGVTTLEKKDVEMSMDGNEVYIEATRSPYYSGKVTLIV